MKHEIQNMLSFLTETFDDLYDFMLSHLIVICRILVREAFFFVWRTYLRYILFSFLSTCLYYILTIFVFKRYILFGLKYVCSDFFSTS